MCPLSLSPELRDAGVNYAVIFNAASNGMAFTDAGSGIIVDVNDAWCRATGISREEAVGKTALALGIWELPEDRAALVEILNRNGRVINFETNFVMREETRAYLISAQVVSVRGKEYVLWDFKDVAEYRQAQENFQKFFELIPELVCIASNEGRFLKVNRRWAEILGYAEEELLAKPYLDFVHPDDREATVRQAGKAREGETTLRFVNRYRCKDGTYRWLEWNSVSANNVVYAAARDITETLRIHQEIESSRRQLNDAQRIAHVGSWEWNIVDDTAVWSDETYRIWGFEPGGNLEDHRRGFINMTHPEDRERTGKALSDAVRGLGPYNLEYRIVLPDGSLKYIHSRGEVIRDETGAPLLMRGTAQDITDLKHAEAALTERDLQYRMAIETSVDGFWMVDLQGKLLEVNEAYCRMSGYSREELLQMYVPDLDCHYDARRVAERMEEIVRNAGALRFESRHRRRDGSSWPVGIVVTFALLGAGRFFAFITDLSEQKAAEEGLRLASLVYQNSSEAMLVTDADNNIISANPAFEAMTGYTLAEVRGKNPRVFKSGRHDYEFYREMWRQLEREGHWHGEVWDRNKKGELHVKLLTINIIRDETGKAHRYVALFRDITERKKAEELIWWQANYDNLTKLPNRQMFYDRLKQEEKKCLRTGRQMALLLIDLDRFKEVNDTLGHDKGDMLLMEAARRIASCVRNSDTVARLGGDEFVVILPEIEEASTIERIAKDIIGSLTSRFQLDGEEAYVSASLGISIYPADTDNLDELFKNSDQAMYSAKNAGRNRYSYFTPVMQQMARDRLELTNDLRHALSQHELEVYYQPIVELKSGEIIKAEALLRWSHPVRGMVSPALFIPLAEDVGLIHDIGNWVFNQAAATIADWKKRLGTAVQVSVNRSPVEFDRGDFKWIEMLNAAGLPGASVTMEITEGLLLNQSDEVQKRLMECRNAGIEVSIDDFGTGFSALSYLKLFDIDYLKIDRSFISNLTEEESDKALVEAIIVMAHKLNIKTIAEGVETEAQRDLLIAFDCDYAQGYLYSRPVPASEFERLLKK